MSVDIRVGVDVAMLLDIVVDIVSNVEVDIVMKIDVRLELETIDGVDVDEEINEDVFGKKDIDVLTILMKVDGNFTVVEEITTGDEIFANRGEDKVDFEVPV